MRKETPYYYNPLKAKVIGKYVCPVCGGSGRRNDEKTRVIRKCVLCKDGIIFIKP